MCAWVTLIAVAGLLAWITGSIAALVVFGAGALVLMLSFSSLQGIYLATLYRYATDGVAPVGFDDALLRQAFVSRNDSHTTLNLHKSR